MAWSSPCRCLRPYWRPPFLMGHLLGWVHRNGPTCAPSIRNMWILTCGWTTIRSYVERPYYLGRFWVQYHVPPRARHRSVQWPRVLPGPVPDWNY
jgi:hypothetical protein